MSFSRTSSYNASAQKTQRLRSFRTLLDPTDLLPGHNVADLYSLRHLCLQGGGIPDTASSSADGWLRAQAWRVLLGYLTPEKSDWSHLLEKRRAEYYQFVRDFLPQEGTSSPQGIPGKLSERDALLDQIYRDLARSRKNAFAFYREEIKSCRSCPLAPPPDRSSSPGERLANRHSLLHRLEIINDDFAHSIKEDRRFDDSTREPLAPDTPKRGKEMLLTVSDPYHLEPNPSITLEPASPRSSALHTPDAPSVISDGDSYFASADEGEHEDEVGTGEGKYIDRRWHSLLRILYIYALLNPSMGYVQGMNEVLFVLLYVMGTSGRLPTAETFRDSSKTEEDAADDGTAENAYLSAADASASYLDSAEESPGAHAEADAFWCFSALVGDIRELYDFDGIEHAGLRIMNKRQADNAGSLQTPTGMAGALRKFSLRLKWLDEELWKQLHLHSLDPRLPYYSFRWLACIVSTELTLPSVVRIWDAILSESGVSPASGSSEGATTKIDFLIDIGCSLLTNVRGPLLTALQTEDVEEGDLKAEDSFGRAMRILQAYPDDDVGPIIEMACLYRQKRLAAPLTGDGPPEDDDYESHSILSSVRGRAAEAFRSWSSPAASSRSTKWMYTSPRTPAAAQKLPTSTPSRSSSAALLRRYTDALQSSDAAANFSKASTNFTAKAIATWNGARNAGQPTGADSSPLSEMKTAFFNRVKGSNMSPEAQKEALHPSLRWSMNGEPPEIPLPNVNDSPPGRSERTSVPSPLRGFTSVNRIGSASLVSPDHHMQSPDLGYADSTPGTSPTSGSISRFGALPPLPSTPRTMVRGAGPKPLLLTGSARPPREGSANGTLGVNEPVSRKVSSGPLAGNPSPRQRRHNGSSSRRDSSYGGSVTSSVAGRDSLDNDGSDDVVSSKDNALPPLPSLQAAREMPVPISSSAVTAMTTPLGLQGSGHGSGSGTVPASAFSKVRTSPVVSDEPHREGLLRSAPGLVASSGDVPLISKSTLQRKPRRMDSSNQAEQTAPYTDAALEAATVSSAGSSITSSRHVRQASSNTTQQSSPSFDSFERPRQPPALPSEVISDPKDVQRYSLVDEPVSLLPSAPSRTEDRRSGGSIGSGTRLVGFARSRRTLSSGKRERVRRSLDNTADGFDSGDGTERVWSGGRATLRSEAIHEVEPPRVIPPEPPLPLMDPNLLMPAEELLNRLQIDQGFSGGESSGIEDEVLPPKQETSSSQDLAHFSRDIFPHSSGSDAFKQRQSSLMPSSDGYGGSSDGITAVGSALASANIVPDEGGGASLHGWI